jgi:DNA polymerase-3 subunit beta
MQLTVSRHELKEAVTGFSKVIGTHTSLPILACVRFNSNGVITAEGTDLDQTARYTFANATADRHGVFTVPLANLKELAKGDEKDSIEFETGAGTTVNITNQVGTQTVKHPLNGMDPTEWPVCPAEIATMPAAGFLETYRKLIPFASTDNTRYVLNGIFIEVADKGEHPVTMVATDGRRLSLWNTMNLPLSKSVIIPTTKFLSWNGLAGDTSIGLRTERKKKEVRVMGLGMKVGPWFYDVRVVDGIYPNFRQVIGTSEDSVNRITFTDQDVTTLRKILPTFPGSSGYDAGIKLRAGTDGNLVIAGKGKEDKTETALELNGGSKYEGEMPAIGVNGFYLLDALDAGFRVFTTADKVTPLRSEDGKGGIHVLMPLKIGDTPVKRVPTSTAEKTNETTPPSAEPAAEHNKKEVEMPENKETKTGTTENEVTALDKVLVAYETAKQKVREANQALSEIADAVKAAVKEQKQQRAEVENVRQTLAKLQTLKIA